jgi:hypothetical protein
MPRIGDLESRIRFVTPRQFDDVAKARYGAAEDVESGPDVADATGRKNAHAMGARRVCHVN